MSIIVIISKPLPCCKNGAVVSVTNTVNRITCYRNKIKVRISLVSKVCLAKINDNSMD